MPSRMREQLAVVLIGHGAPATDCPPQLVGELMSLEWRHNHTADSLHLQTRAAELDAQIRDWPRHAGNDPYRAGLEQVADALRPLVPSALVAVGYNEFCRPSLPEAIDDVIRQGATRVVVISSMLTPGGVHAEQEIPHALDIIRRAHPTIAIQYVWPFDIRHVAALLAQHVNHAIADPSA